VHEVPVYATCFSLVLVLSAALAPPPALLVVFGLGLVLPGCRWLLERLAEKIRKSSDA
jgi:hypothetical protein